MDFKSLMSGAGSAQITAGIADLDQQARTVSAQRSETEANRRASLAELDDDRVDELDGRLRAWDRELERIAERRRQLKVRLEEVLQLEKRDECDALVAQGEAVRDKGLKKIARYEEIGAELHDDVLPAMAETERQVKDINAQLAAAGDARRVRTPIGVLVDQRGQSDRVDVPGYAKLPAVVGKNHFWPKPR
jgi:hypothetical protein